MTMARTALSLRAAAIARGDRTDSAAEGSAVESLISGREQCSGRSSKEKEGNKLQLTPLVELAPSAAYFAGLSSPVRRSCVSLNHRCRFDPIKLRKFLIQVSLPLRMDAALIRLLAIS